LPEVIAHLEAAGAKPGISVAVYEDDGGGTPEGEIVLHAGFAIGDQEVAASETVRVVNLSTIEVAAAVYREGDEGIMGSPRALDRRQRIPSCRRLPRALPRVAR
jgi:hypothetical protein